MRDLIMLAAAGACGRAPASEIVDWNSVVHLAAEQNVLPLVACALANSPTFACPTEIREYLMNVLRMQSSLNLLRQQRIFHLMKELRQVRIEPKLLKGYSIARYYAYPESRDSVDTDIWVEADREQDALSFLQGIGFEIQERGPASHHSVAQHRKFGKVEIHTTLYDEIVEQVWFQGMDGNEYVCEKPQVIQCADGEFLALGLTDQLIFLSLHMIKHFISGGISIRMMLDIALHFAKNKKLIDADRYWKVLNGLQYANLVNCIFGIMVASGAFGCEDFPGMWASDAALEDALLLDLKLGGYMGAKEVTEREMGGMEYNRQLLLKRMHPIQYVAYMLCWKVRGTWTFMFPSFQKLKQQYRIVGKMPIIAPVIWAYHAVKHVLQRVKSGVLKRQIRNKHSGMSECAKERLRLFQKLGML